MKRRVLPVLTVACLMAFALLSECYAVRDSQFRYPQLPRLDIDPPATVAVASGGVPSAWKPSLPEWKAAVERGRAQARSGKPAIDVLAPWRVVVDKGGEYATLLTPTAVGSMLGYQAEERSWSDATLEQRGAEALSRFGSGVCVYVELRSFAHESRAFGSAGEIRPGTPGEAYEATFLLDSGGQKYEGTTPKLEQERMGQVAINSAGLHYQPIYLPEVGGSATLFGEQTTGKSFGANYYVWWPFADAEGGPTFGADATSFRLTIITPTRKREYSFTVTPEGLRTDQKQPGR